MNKALKWILILLGCGLLFAGGCMFCFDSFFDFGPYYSRQDLVDNYDKKAASIQALRDYVTAITPAGKGFHIEFDGSDQLAIFHVDDAGNYEHNWQLELHSGKTDSLLHTLGWEHNTLVQLRSKLEAANCISVQSGNPCVIGFKRSGFGLYSYDIFDRPLNDSLRRVYNDSCTHIFYRDNIVLEYGGGAVGPQCFPVE
jgi:hypothetical protein